MNCGGLGLGKGVADVVIACGRIHVIYGDSVDVLSLLSERLIDFLRLYLYSWRLCGNVS
jgi:hypothetical protein